MEQKFLEHSPLMSESSMERKFLDFRSSGTNVPRNESSTGAKVLSMDFSLAVTKVQRNEKARYQKLCFAISVQYQYIFSKSANFACDSG